MHGNGEYAIRRQMVNVLIDIQTTVSDCLPIKIPDDVATDVHLGLLCKPVYKSDVMKVH